jgi:glycosyltransferase involved in cell wall biosynthesis
LITAECHVHNSVFSSLKWRAGSFRIKKRFADFVARKIDFCFPISNESAVIASEFFAYPKSQLKVVPLGTDIELFKPEHDKLAGRVRLGWKPDAFICIYTGKLIEAKGPHILVKAVNLLNLKGHNVQAVIIGDGEDDYARSLVTPNSSIIPFMPAKKLNQFYSVCDLGVWPKQESTSQLDALASGLPIIISDRHGDISRSEGSGSTYIEGDAADLAKKIEYYRVNKKMYREHALAARRKAETFYSWELVARQYLESINRILGKE